MQLIVSLIIENQNGGGANIEKVVSEAVKREIDKEKLLSDIQRQAKSDMYFRNHQTLNCPEKALLVTLAAVYIIGLWRRK
ncbi:MAG: hypothetical protein SCH39_13390 [Methanosarcinales archaeon]|nr:hypothetical protein [Methanosarcinales archaeon]